jgi:hypothetical protein
MSLLLRAAHPAHRALRHRGVLPEPSALAWPREPFASQFLGVLKRLEMPRFTRRHPQLLRSLMRQFLQLVEVRRTQGAL